MKTLYFLQMPLQFFFFSSDTKQHAKIKQV